MRILLLVLSLPIVLFGGKLPDGFVEFELATGLNPTSFVLSPEGQIFLSEKNGTIRIIRDGKLLETPFFKVDVDNSDERGLQMVQLDPDFIQNNYIYLYYAVPNKGHNRVSRITANGDRAIPGSEVILMELDPLAGKQHNGGQLLFIEDKTLLISTGDGLAQWRAQAFDDTAGKILRINRDGSIPTDNPFYELTEGKYRSIYALGLRNPFNMAKDSESNQIFINEVGGDNWEEVNVLIKGANYGWPIVEGKITTQTPPDDYEDPLYAYDHDIGCAIVGGIFYPESGGAFPKEYAGKYFFSDYCKGYIKVLDPDNGNVLETFATDIDRALRLLVDAEGNLYYIERAGLGGGTVNDNTGSSNGRILKVVYTGSGAPVISRQPVSRLVSVGENLTFHTSANGSEPLQYEWYIDGVAQMHNNDTIELSNLQLGQNGQEIYCIVSNNEGSDTSKAAMILVTANNRPEAIIDLNTTSSQYIAGEEIIFAGSGMDLEDGTLDEDKMVWWIDFHHDLHSHPALPPTTGVASGTYPVPRAGEVDDNVWFRVYLQVTDSEGLSHTQFHDIYPIKVEITVQSEPMGMPINIDGDLESAPVTFKSVMGIERTLAASSFHFEDGKAFQFLNWENVSDNEIISFAADQSTTMFKANYAQFALGNGQGLTGRYYQYDQEPIIDGEPLLTRVDSVIDFFWKRESPDTNFLEPDRFMVRWTGFVEAINDGEYTFAVHVDDGVRLWIDGEMLLDEWRGQPAGVFESRPLSLKAGKKYAVILEFLEVSWWASIKFLWSNEYLAQQVVPQSQLYPEDLSFVKDNISVITYPNPISDFLEVDFFIKKPGRLDYQIVDTKGRIIEKGGNDGNLGLFRLKANTSDWPNGTYFVHYYHSSGVKGSRRLLKIN